MCNVIHEAVWWYYCIFLGFTLDFSSSLITYSFHSKYRAFTSVLKYHCIIYWIRKLFFSIRCKHCKYFKEDSTLGLRNSVENISLLPYYMYHWEIHTLIEKIYHLYFYFEINDDILFKCIALNVKFQDLYFIVSVIFQFSFIS